MINVSKQESSWTVSLNRPDKANALTLDMLAELDSVFAQAALAPDLRFLVVTGTGNRVFSAGADLGQAGNGENITLSPLWESLSGRLANLPCLTIAALNGTLAGGAFGMALACDLRIAVPNARFFYPVLQNGFMPQPSDVKRMATLIGPARTKLIFLAGQKLDAERALAYGMIDEIVPLDAMADRLSTLSAAALSADAKNLAAIKRLCNSA